MEINKDEFYRSIDELKGESLRIRELIIGLRTDTSTVALGLALLRAEVDALKQTKRDYREWIAMTIIGATIGAIDYLIHRFAGR